MQKQLYDLTNPQMSIWLIEQFYQGTNMGNVCGTLVFNQLVNFKFLEKALNMFVEQNEAIRIELVMEDGFPKQYMEGYSSFDIDILEFKDINDLKQWEEEHVSKSFTLLESPLYKFTMFKFPDGTGGYNAKFHHVIADAWTMSLLINSVSNIYSLLLKGENIPEIHTPSYIDYINKENDYLISETFKRDKDFWNSQFTTIPDITTLPSLFETTISKQPSSASSRQEFNISRDTVNLINEFCKIHKASIFNFLMGVFALYLSRINNTNDIVLGTPILNRGNYKEKQTAGMFISTVPFNIAINNEQSFGSFISDISINFLKIFRHQKYPYQYLLKDLREKRANIPNLYNIMISYQNSRDTSKISEVPYSTRWLDNNNISDDVDIHIYDTDDTGSLFVAYDYLLNKYQIEDIEIMHNKVLCIISQILNNPNIKLNAIKLVTPDEENKLIYEFNDTKMAYDDSKTLIELFEEQVLKTPNKIAVKFGNDGITYKSLYQKACNVASVLIKNNVKKNDIVSLLVPRSIEMVVSILGILKAGACYNPIDIHLPDARISTILDEAKPKYLITTKQYSPQFDSVNCLIIHDIQDTYNSESEIDIKYSPEDLAYVLFTSGSTGTPKGVLITNKNVVGLLNAIKDEVPTSEEDVITMFHTYCFDVSVMEMYNALLHGSTLIVLSEEECRDPMKLLIRLREDQVTILQQTPSSFYRTVEFEELFNDNNLTLRMVIVAGEQVQSKNLLYWSQKYPNCKLLNGYGPTEATILATIGEITSKQIVNNKVDIGRALPNYQIYILDKHLNNVPVGFSGEMYIGGIGVSRGYLNRDDLTNAKFINNPFGEGKIYNTGDIAKFLPNKRIECLGRSDDQVKVNGYRLELEEIQGRMLEYSGIKEPIVIAIDDKEKGSKFLVGFYVADTDVNIDKLKKHLKRLLPYYAVPSYFCRLSEYPSTISGKVDKKALIEFFNNNSINSDEIVLPRNFVQKDIYSVIESITKKSDFSITDNFSNIGIDSLNVLNALIKLNTYDLSAQDFYDYPTIESLSEKILNKLNKNTINEFNYIEDIRNIIIPNKSSKLNLKNVLLTGSTGFLGSHVLKDLINNNSVDKIYCLVRTKNNKSGTQRLEEVYEYYFEDTLTKFINKKVFPIEGDFSSKDFNMPYELSEKITTVINVGANVNHIGSMHTFYRDNVESVKNIIEFCKKNNASIAHISTVSVAGFSNISSNRKVFDENCFYVEQDFLNNVYLITKLLAEYEILKAINEDNLNCKIFRLGNIMPRSFDGKFQRNVSSNAFVNRLKACIELGAIPDLYLDTTRFAHVELSPVDFCSKSIVQLLEIEDSQTIYHIFNNHYFDIISFFKKYSHNELKVLDINEFKQLIQNTNTDSAKYIMDELKVLNSVENNMENKMTVQKLNKLGFKWSDYTKDYEKQLLKILLEGSK